MEEMDNSQDSDNFLLNDLSPRKNPVKLNFPASLGRRSPLKPSNKSVARLTSSLSSIHGGRVLKELNSFRNQGLLCDVAIVANGTRIEAHRTILAANSKFLCDQLVKIAARAKSPVTKPEIVLEGISIASLRAVTSFMYTSELGGGGEATPSLEHLLDVFSAAEKLQMAELKAYCLAGVQSALTAETCLQALQNIKVITSAKLKAAIQKYIAQNFMLLVNSGVDYQSIPAKDMLAITQHEDFQSNGTALELLRALLSWVESGGESHMSHAESLIAAIRFHDIRPIKIQEEISAIESRLSEPEDAALKQAILSCIAGRTQDCIRPSHMTQAPGETSFMLLGGDEATGAPTARTLTYSLADMEWVDAEEPMPIRRLDHASTALNGVIYVAGGQHTGHQKAADSIGTLHGYDTRTASWAQLCPMQKRRAVFTLVTLDNRVYAVGGKNAHGSLASVESYDPATETWAYASHLYTGLFGHAGVVMGGKIYVTGGVVAGRHFTNALQCYHPRSDKWVHMSAMATKRAFHMMCAVGGKLYVFGGNTRDATAKRVDCDTMECYDPEADAWETIESMPRPVCFAGAVSHGEKIYVIGGFSGKKAKRHADVQCYDVMDRTWSLIGQLPEPIMRFSVTAVTAPKALIVH